MLSEKTPDERYVGSILFAPSGLFVQQKILESKNSKRYSFNFHRQSILPRFFELDT